MEAVSNHLLLNPGLIPPESAAAIAVTLSRFPAAEVRAALASASRERFGPLQVDRVLRVLADRLWKEHQLPPPADIAVAEIWRHIYHSRPHPWSHPAVSQAADRYGWDALLGGEVETASVRKAQVRDIYEDMREREVSRWIAQVCLDAEGQMRRQRA